MVSIFYTHAEEEEEVEVHIQTLYVRTSLLITQKKEKKKKVINERRIFYPWKKKYSNLWAAEWERERKLKYLEEKGIRVLEIINSQHGC